MKDNKVTRFNKSLSLEPCGYPVLLEIPVVKLRTPTASPKYPKVYTVQLMLGFVVQGA